MKPRLCGLSTHDICLFLGISEFLGFRHAFGALVETGACAGDSLEGKGSLLKMSRHELWLRSPRESQRNLAGEMQRSFAKIFPCV